MFERCDFILGENNSLVIVLPGNLPAAENYTVSASPKELKFRAGYDEIARFTYSSKEVYDRLTYNPQVGLVEFPVGESFPNAITAVAYVEIRGGA